MWFRKKKKVPNAALNFVLAKISKQLHQLIAIRFHGIYGNENNYSQIITHFENKDYQNLQGQNNIKWDSDFIFLISCEFKNKIQILILRMPYEYLDAASFLYEKEISKDDYDKLSVLIPSYSNYFFIQGKLVKALSTKGDNLFDTYDFHDLS